MFCWRITKYNPQYRSAKGAFLKQEWTSYSDIGKSFDGKKLTAYEYLKIENAYVDAVTLFMECLNLDKLSIINLNKHNRPEKEGIYSFDMVNTYNSLRNNQFITRELIDTIVRLILRENIWCKLVSEAMYVHFGYDYYMYIGSENACKDAVEKIKKLGLFVESFASPYNS